MVKEVSEISPKAKRFFHRAGNYFFDYYLYVSRGITYTKTIARYSVKKEHKLGED